jgi:hypothetical protein
MGPTAQDFYAAYGLGYNNTSISTADADGVALAAAQGLYDLSQEQAARIQQLEAENTDLQTQLDAQQAQIDALGARLTALEGGSPASSRPASGLLWPGAGIALAGVGVALFVRRKGGTG